MNDLKTEFDAVTRDLLVDTNLLAEVAVRRGTRIRRRNRAAAGLAAAAVLAAAVAGPATIAALRGQAENATPPVLSAPAPAVDEEPITGRSTAAALKQLVVQRVPGSVSRSQSQSTTVDGAVHKAPAPGVYAKLWFQRNGEEAVTPIMINVDGAFDVALTTCAEVSPTLTCREAEVGAWNVVVFERSDGGAVARYAHAYDAGRRLRVVVSSTNGEDFEKVGPGHRAPRAVVAAAPLTLQQLEEIATWAGWGPTLDKTLGDLGESLPAHDDIINEPTMRSVEPPH